MKLKQLLQQLEEVQKRVKTSPAFICGGVPRDKYNNKLENVADVDITTGDKTIHTLADEFSIYLSKKYNIVRKTMDDHHSSIFFGNLKLDFSSNFIAPNIISILNKMGINNPTEMQKEMYSRDFTCNALLLSLDLKNITDPTHKGFEDIKNKIIKTCLAPEITLTTNKNRVVRSIYLACKLGFDVDQSIINYVKSNPDSMKFASPKSLVEKLNKAFEKDADKASFLLTQMNAWQSVPISEIMYPYYTKNVKRLLNAK